MARTISSGSIERRSSSAARRRAFSCRRDSFSRSSRSSLLDADMGPPGRGMIGAVGQPRDLRSRPTSIRSKLLRSPMIRRSGSGTLRTRVGMATIWSSLARRGFSSRSTTSISYRPGIRSSQNRSRFSRAATHLGEQPATYNRSRHLCSAPGAQLPCADRVASSHMSSLPRPVAVDPAAPGHVGPIPHDLLLAAPGLGDGLLQLLLAGLKIGAEGGDPGLQRVTPPFEFAALAPDLLLPRQGGGPLPGLLGE